MVRRLIPYEKPNEAFEKYIIEQYVNGRCYSRSFRKDYASFFQQYNSLLQNSVIVKKVNGDATVAEEDDATNLACNSHEHLMCIVKAIRNCPTCDRHSLHQALRKDAIFRQKEPAKIDQSINVALSLWLTIDFKKSTQLLDPPPVPGEQPGPSPRENEQPTPVSPLNREGQHTPYILSDLERQGSQAIRDWLTFLLQPIANLISRPITQRVEIYRGRGPLKWDGTETLKSVVSQRFQNLISTEATKMGVTFQTSFTAVNLKRFCGVEIDLLCNLEDHLKFNRELRTLKIYPLKGYLHDMKRSGVGIIPDRVIDETIMTLNLLFPNWDTHTLKFFKKKKSPEHNVLVAEPVYYPAPIHLNEFSYWRDRLRELYVEFNSPSPGWKQLWNDRRNPLQWYTFWFAVFILGLTTIFGVIGSVTAVYSMNYARQAAQFAAAADATAKACPPITCGRAPSILVEL